MNASRKYVLNVVATGFVVLLILAVPLFWARFLCETLLREIMPPDARQIVLRPTGLFDPEIENDANIGRVSSVGSLFFTDLPELGIQDWFVARGPAGRLSNAYFYSHGKLGDWSILYFDEKTDLIIFHRVYTERMADDTFERRQTVLYAGPEGMSDSADKALGRFAGPLINPGTWNSFPELFVYDKTRCCFFALNFGDRIVRKGPQLKKDDPHRPIKVGSISKNWSYSYISLSPPMVVVPVPPAGEEGDDSRRRTDLKPKLKSAVEDLGIDCSGQYVLVLDESGQIDFLDKATLEFAGPAGFLPAPRTFFGSKDSPGPRDLLAYDVLPAALVREDRYLGMCVATVAREGTSAALAVFDEKGRLVKTAYSVHEGRGEGDASVPSSEAVYFSSPGAPGLTVTKYLLENLQPPVLSAASYLTAESFEAGSGQRALFILPNSFIGMKAREVTDEVIDKYLSALLLILPSLILAGLLAWRVHGNAVVVGLSHRARFWWVLGTIAFGLSAYITYRLTRPKITPVTCVNCGRLRRPDMETCHRCGAAWEIPELTPPAWRVIAEQPQEGEPATANTQ
ncbi:MAG TPA: hypothetical protein VMX13_13355 [Sedimentisphaerales bacterium]|nr:hypothetical protein [Sedimentisphaerales bacterium]